MQDSDSEKETEEETGSRHDESERNNDRSPDIGRPRRSRFRDVESPDSRSAKEGSPVSNFAPSLPKRSREEILQDVVSFFPLFSDNKKKVIYGGSKMSWKKFF